MAELEKKNLLERYPKLKNFLEDVIKYFIKTMCNETKKYNQKMKDWAACFFKR